MPLAATLFSWPNNFCLTIKKEGEYLVLTFFFLGYFSFMEWVKIFSDEAEARQRVFPDKPQLLILHGKRISLVLHQAQFFAVQDSCSHNGESLSKGRVNHLGEIICPWHGYRFKLESGRACDSDCRDLATYPLKIDDTGFYVGVL
jgi:nitrite reductase/ring-hydroxylating ferredoxin subunit